jgi:pyruvate dehydrogenase E2 component (dihydrolipoamide acetyltransferase)
MPNLALTKKKKLSLFRKMAIGTWQTAYDPQVYGQLTLRMDKAAQYLAEYRQKSGLRLTYSHMMAKAVSAMYEKMPDANAILRWNKIYMRKRIGVFFQVVMEDPKTGELDLSGATLYDPETKALGELVTEFERRTAKVRTGEDKKEKSRGMFRFIPHFILNRFMKIMSFFSYTLNLNLRWAGVPRDPFGSIMISNIGSIGLEQAFAPLVPYSRVPLVVVLGAVTEEPVVDDGEIVPGKLMRVCATFDHRVLDGAHAAVMVKTVRKWFDDPYKYFGPIPEAKPELAAEAEAG